MPRVTIGLEQAVQAAKRGKRDRACKLFLDIIDQDPCNLPAWLWLSKLINDPQDQISALENAIQLSPQESKQRRALEERLEQAQREHPELVEHANTPEVRAALDRQCDKVQELLNGHLTSEAVALAQSIVAADPRQERAWLLLSEFHPDPYQQVEALKAALLVNINNAAAWKRLKMLDKALKSPIQTGRLLEERGQFEQAVEVYLSVIAHSRSSLQRGQAQRCLDQMKLRQESESMRPIHANLTLVRLAAGPVILFAMMVFLQSGLNPLHITLLACPGVLSVLLGSLLLSAMEMRPIHPWWISLFGASDPREASKTRGELRLLSLLLMLAPFTMFLIAASYRLGVLQASMFSR